MGLKRGLWRSTGIGRTIDTVKNIVDEGSISGGVKRMIKSQRIISKIIAESIYVLKQEIYMHSAERKEDKQMPKLLIIDGSSMLSTSYYGNLPKSILFAKTEEEKEKHYGQILHTSDGKYTNAMFTMLRTLLGIYKKVKPEYVAFVFDKTRDTFRRTELGADFYKANRKETAKPLKEQFIQMEEFLQEIGCAVFMSDDYEADDYAASLVEKFEGPDLQTYVLTKDHDYFQVVSEYTRMWRVVNKDKLEQLKKDYGFFGSDVYESLPANVFEYTPEIVYAEEGVYPQQIPVLLAITGDPGDGIPGCKGVSSAAAPLVDEYKSLDEIYAAIDDCEGVAKKEKELNGFWKEYLGIGRSPLKALKTNREMVYLSEKLATMKRDIDISCGIEDLKLRVDIEKLKEELGRYEMFSLIKEVENL